MATEDIKFGVALDRKTDARFADIARVEGRSKRSMHSFMIRRIADLWERNPDTLKNLGLVRPAQGGFPQ